MNAGDIGDDLALAEQARLDACAREPIRTPGAIQPHGALLAIDTRSFVVTVASENCARMLGSDESLLGRYLVDVTSEEFEAAVRGFAAAPHTETNPLPLQIAGQRLDAIVHRTGVRIVIEFEPSVSMASGSTASLYSLIHWVARSTTVDDLRRDTVRGLRALTGFDRVMMYHFHPDGHGEVVAEDRAPDMERYLGLHFPASDIPAQARALYLTKLSRAIVGTSGESVGLLSVEDEADVASFDLSDAELRSVSPHHLQFMRNMGQEATLSFSLVRDGQLIGMITCAHRTLLRLPFLMRRGIEVLANQVALQLSALDQVERLRRQVAVRTSRAQLMAQVAQTDDIAESLVRGAVTVRDLVPADGVVVRIAGRTRTSGMVPPTAQFEALYRRIAATWSTEPFASESLAAEHPELAAVAPSVTGVLLVLIGGAGDYLAFFRSEVTQHVDWLGDQTSANRASTFSPRTSFSSWTQSASGTSDPWNELTAESLDLARDLESALLRKVESELAHLAMLDPLTGLPNRRGLTRRLERRLNERDPEDHLALLFIDLDGFKTVNDSFGHNVGDALIAHVGRRISSATRAGDTVARLGGDEFVVLCAAAGEDEVAAIAGRVLAAIREPARIGGVSLTITASVGSAIADGEVTAADLLQRADEAMYRAKGAGKNAVSL